MSMLRLKFRKKAFTLAETMIVCTIFAMMVVWIILWINRAFVFMNNTRVKVRAINFAREWVEMVYNLRDTNRRKCSWKKDDIRFYLGTGVSQECSVYGYPYLKEWIYTIKEWNKNSWDKFVYAEDLGIAKANVENFYDLEWFFDESNRDYREKSKVSFLWNYSYYSWGEIATWKLENLLEQSGVKFYRVLRVYGVYKKAVTTSEEKIDATNRSAEYDGNSSNGKKPVELRFCVKVFYEINWWHHASELCSIMTNFME